MGTNVVGIATSAETNNVSSDPTVPYAKLHSQSLGVNDTDLSSIYDCSTTATASCISSRTDETCPLLQNRALDATSGPDIERRWDDASGVGGPRTIWWREAHNLVVTTVPLVTTLLLQYSINMIGIFAAGQIGKVELGAVSLANMTLTITYIAPLQGLATSLDTLCAQAYGNGRFHLVGIHCQRLSVSLLLLSVPIALLWMISERIFGHFVADAECARLAALYLKVMIFSMPGTVLFETGKRLLQAQGIFKAATAMVAVAAPVSVFLNWILVWKVEFGFIGAALAVAATRNLLGIFLIFYVVFVDGLKCWGGFSRKAFTNWGVMSRLAIPGLIMLEAELLAFEIMTFFSSTFGTEYLAAQSILVTFCVVAYQIPLAISIAASTRVATLIGAGIVERSKIAAKMAFIASFLVSMMNFAIYLPLRFHLPAIFSDDQQVITLTAQAIPFAATMQFFDGLGAGAHGLLRGTGKQSIGGPTNLFSYYIISLPASLWLAFQLDWRIEGLWAGTTVGALIVSLIEYTYLLQMDWRKACIEAEERNSSN
ncbi:mate-domain-containing protein [Xylariales sp. PMI_506]|nr:mate-domain-containing protein [Xylariales sp. PMI_506]